MKHRPGELVEALNLVLYSRETYFRFLQEIDNPLEDEIQRAARFIYVVKNSFGSGCGKGWGYGKTSKAKTVADLAFLNEIQGRLKSVYIDNRSFEKVINAFDSKDTLFYLDPPYWIDAQKFYQHDFSPEDHERLRAVLGRIKGKFVLSYNDTKEIRSMYRGFKILATSPVHYSMNNKRSQPRKKSEIIITSL